MDVAGFADTLAPTGYPGRLHPPLFAVSRKQTCQKTRLA
ncbi:hypothetical protein SB48_HM08orf06674 [Heyndrickxia coagulans]|uniref:Uncharacterized protein n=1 Tax=Heyndrickxia coagulans TaxID=1398 RepID=A0AAN0TAD3_HEYCO|nr:hypothetical protein SB48_HM08orf06674 [Heyndrickxia coagulans]